MKRLRIILISLAVLLVGVLVLCLVQPKEPSYQGRKLSEWLRYYYESGWDLDKFADVGASTRASEHAVKEIGTNAIPALLRWLKTKASPIKIKLNSLLDRQSVISFRFKTTNDWSKLAECGFLMLGDDAMPAVPALVRLSNSQDEKQREHALLCILYIDKDKKRLLPVLLQLFRSPTNDLTSTLAQYLDSNYPNDAERAGVYKMFPDLKPSTTNGAGTNLPAAQ
jgi:hypothetical protein